MPEENIKFDKDGTPMIDLDTKICEVIEDNGITVRWYAIPMLFKKGANEIIKTFEYNYKTNKWEEVDD